MRAISVLGGLAALGTATAQDACTGVSVTLPTEQCAAWIELFDAAGGENWYHCQRQRTDPCGCQDGQVCNKARTAIKSLVFLDLNNMQGTLPASMKNMVNLTQLNVMGNALTGAFPDLPWHNIGVYQLPFLCSMYGATNAGTAHNTFDCPLPDGAIGKVAGVPACQKISRGEYVDVTADDCGGGHAPTPAPLPKYHCKNNTCVKAASGGVPLRTCKAACG